MTSHETYFEKYSIKLIGKVFLYDKCNATTDVVWTKNGNEIDTLNSGGKYSKVSTDDSSLTISDVNEHDAGSYQLTATNNVGSTQSDVIVLGNTVWQTNAVNVYTIYEHRSCIMQWHKIKM